MDIVLAIWQSEVKNYEVLIIAAVVAIAMSFIFLFVVEWFGPVARCKVQGFGYLAPRIVTIYPKFIGTATLKAWGFPLIEFHREATPQMMHGKSAFGKWNLAG